mgnify:CR=1 FL=1
MQGGGGGAAAGDDVVVKKLAVFFGKADIAAVGLELGGVGGIDVGDGNIDVGFGGGIVGDGDAASKGPGLVEPGGDGIFSAKEQYQNRSNYHRSKNTQGYK